MANDQKQTQRPQSDRTTIEVGESIAKSAAIRGRTTLEKKGIRVPSPPPPPKEQPPKKKK